MTRTRKLVFMALLTAVELTIWVIEGQFPAPIPVPGVKLGLASVVTLTAMAVLGRRLSCWPASCWGRCSPGASRR